MKNLNPKSEILNSKQIQKSKFQYLKHFFNFRFWSLGFVSNLEIRNSNFRRRGGFTIIEMIIYLAICSIILVSISYLIIDILAGQTRNYAADEVNQNLAFISDNLIKDIKSASAINSLTASTLVLAIPSNIVTYNFDGVNQKLTRQLGGNLAVDVSSNLIDVSGGFSNFSYLTRSANVGVSLVISYKNPDNLPDYNSTTTASFTVELRGRR